MNHKNAKYSYQFVESQLNYSCIKLSKMVKASPIKTYQILV